MDLAPALLLTLLAVALPAYGQAYKCRQPDGSTQISSEPCSGGARTLKEVDAAPVPEEVREQAERDVERQRRQADKLEASRKADEAQERRDAEAQILLADASAQAIDKVMKAAAGADTSLAYLLGEKYISRR